MLVPRRVKHRKQHHPTRRGMASGGTQVAFGEFSQRLFAPQRVNQECTNEYIVGNVWPHGAERGDDLQR